MTITFKPARSSAYPIRSVTYYGQGVLPREGDYVHLHEQGRLARVAGPPVYMVTERGITGVVVHVVGTNPDAAPLEY